MLLYQIVQIVYWLALSTWFGSVLFIAVAAPIIFRTIREHDPVLPDVLSVNLEGQHATLLAGWVVGNLLSRLAVLELVCGGVLVVTMVVQPFVIDVGGNNQTAAVLRGALLAVAVALVVYDWRVVWPRIQHFREEYIRHADDPELANPAKEQFDRAHRTSVNLLSGVLFLLLGIVLFSGAIVPRPAERVLGRQAWGGGGQGGVAGREFAQAENAEIGSGRGETGCNRCSGLLIYVQEQEVRPVTGMSVDGRPFIKLLHGGSREPLNHAADFQRRAILASGGSSGRLGVCLGCGDLFARHPQPGDQPL